MDIGVLGPLELHGPVEPRDGTGDPGPIAGARLRTLLSLLALDAGRAVPAGRLADGIWGDAPPTSLGNALQALVSRLRRAAPGLVVDLTPAGYRLVLAPERVDVHRFVRLAGSGRQRLADDPAGAAAELRAALALWRGPALADVAFPAAVSATVARLNEQRLAAQQDRIAAELRLGGGAELVAELEELVVAHPLHEPLAALLMRALLAAGSPGRALSAYEQVRARLGDTLGVDPSPELAELHLAVLRTPVAATNTPVPDPSPPKRGNLPAEVSTFVGRDADVRGVGELVRAHRLVTLTGPGGSGKSRLSIEVGHAESWPDGVWRVELAPVTDPTEVPYAILSALRLRGQPMIAPRPSPMARPESTGEAAEPLARLTDALTGKDLLLILDNCEHLIDTAARVADVLLRAAPGLRILATSREPLGIPGEQVWAVEPLALPPLDAAPTGVAGYPAVRLLLDRALAARPGFPLDEATMVPVVRICRALDGMPLAIELAAARLRTMPADVLADRLTDRFRLLTGGSRAARPRHQTLRAVVDWSWDLLDDAERALWRRLTVFAGGADVAAVERVCAGGPVAAEHVVDLLGALVDKSLLLLVGTRYRMLETIREYGVERLAEAGETATLRIAHARHLLELATAAEPRLRRRDQLDWLHRLTVEHDNLQAALRAAIDAGDTTMAMAFTAGLGWYWWLRGHRVEGAATAREVLDMPGEADVGHRALTYALSAVNGLEGAADFEQVKSWFRIAGELTAACPDPHPLLRLIKPMAGIFEEHADEEVLAQLQPLLDDPDPWVRAIATMMTAAVRLNFGHSADVAEAELREALAGFRALGERWGIGFTLSALGDLAAGRGEYAQAVTWQQEAISLVREVGVREDLPQLQMKLAHQLWLAGDRAEARRTLKLARTASVDIGMSEVKASVEFGHAVIAREDGAFDEAREHLDRAVALIEAGIFAPQFIATIRSTQGLVEASAGDLTTARIRHAEALQLAAKSNDAPVVAMTLVGAADLALRTGDPARAATLLGGAVAVRGAPDRSLPDAERVERAARQALGDPAYEVAYAAGGSMTLANAAEVAGLEPG